MIKQPKAVAEKGISLEKKEREERLAKLAEVASKLRPLLQYAATIRASGIRPR